VTWAVIVELRRQQPGPNLVFASRETAKAWLQDPDHAPAPKRGWDDLLDAPQRTVAQKEAMTLHNAVRDLAATAGAEPGSVAAWKAAHAKGVLRHTLLLYEKTNCSTEEPDGSTKAHYWVEPQPDGSWVEIWDFLPRSCTWSGTAAAQDAAHVWASYQEAPGDDDGNSCVQLPFAATPTYAKTE
jgi:hypothetical protein